MIKYYILFITCLLIFSPLKITAQPELNSTEITLKSPKYIETISVVDRDNKTHIFFISHLKLRHLKYDQSFKLEHQQEYEIELDFDTQIMGYEINADNDINIYLSNVGVTKISTLSISIDDILKENEFKFKKQEESELILNQISHNKSFYILTTKKKSSILKLYKFSNDSYSASIYDFSSEHFYNRHNKPTTLFNLLKKQNIVVIENDIPISVELSSRKFKIYKRKEDLVLTLNHRVTATTTIHLNLTSLKKNIVKDFYIPANGFKIKSTAKSNSFIHEDLIYQLAATRYNFLLQIFDLNNKKFVKEYKFNYKQNIEFNNSPIYEGSGSFSSEFKIIYKTNKFLKKISSQQVGIVTYRKNGDLIVTAGGLSPQSSGGYMMMPGSSFGFSPQWQFVSNPLFWTYNSYENTTSIYTRCLFDSNDLSHKEGFAPINAFDLISIYKKQDIKDLKISLETIFKYDDYFVFAYFDQKNDRYRLFKF